MSLNYNNTFLCNPPALFHYKVNALALALGLVLFIFLRLVVSKIIKGQSLGFYIPLPPPEAAFWRCLIQEVWIEVRFLGAFLVVSHLQ